MPDKKSDDLLNILSIDPEPLKALLHTLFQQVLEEEMTLFLNAEKNEQTEGRQGYRCGYYTRSFTTRVGSLELRIPRERSGEFSTELFQKYQRSEKALVLTIMEMYIQGVSTRKVQHITETLCGTTFSSATVSRLTQELQVQLEAFGQRPLEGEYPYVYLDAIYEKVRENNGIHSMAILIAMGVNTEGRKCLLGIQVANGETPVSWEKFIKELNRRGLKGVKLVITDANEGLRQAVQTQLTGAIWQHCMVHFLRNAYDALPKNVKEECFEELKQIYRHVTAKAARDALKAWLTKWEGKYPNFCEWVEGRMEETLQYLNFPESHHSKLKSSNPIERFNEEERRRTRVVKIFPNRDSCWRLMMAVALEHHEKWQVGPVWLKMSLLSKQQSTVSLPLVQ